MAAEGLVNVKIMGREYRVACPPNEKKALLAAVKLVDDKMCEIAQKANTNLMERVAVMAAMHIAHEHLTLRKEYDSKYRKERLAAAETQRKITDMQTRLDTVLLSEQSLDEASLNTEGVADTESTSDGVAS